ncbi:hypothetical protein, partial [Dysosmobacter sp.]|uniref:hypothetical protein n=1 Tax=Dysosmobacter sp. TaxID=2591382 RepID=UPI003AAA20FF
DEETRDKVIAAEVRGNQTPFWSLNAYLDKFVGVHQLLKSQSMDEEDFKNHGTKCTSRVRWYPRISAPFS